MVHDFPGLKHACFLIRCDSTVRTVYMYDIRLRLVCSSLESKRLSLA